MVAAKLASAIGSIASPEPSHIEANAIVTACSRRLIDALPDIVTFRESAAICPAHLIPDFKACILDCARQTVVRSSPAESDNMPARLEHAPHLRPEVCGERRFAVVPLLAHEAGPSVLIRSSGLAIDGASSTEPLGDRHQGIGRIADTRINGVIRQRLDLLTAVALEQRDATVQKFRHFLVLLSEIQSG